MRGEVDKYSWVDVGGSYVPSEIVCAFLVGPAGIDAANYGTPFRHLQSLPAQPASTGRRGSRATTLYPGPLPGQLAPVLSPLADRAQNAMGCSNISARGVHAVFHYVPLHSSHMGRSFGYRPEDLPVTEELAARPRAAADVLRNVRGRTAARHRRRAGVSGLIPLRCCEGTHNSRSLVSIRSRNLCPNSGGIWPHHVSSISPTSSRSRR